MSEETGSGMEQARAQMVALLKRRGIVSQAVLEAMAQVPREAFVPVDLAGHAYDDGPLPIGQGQTISQPFIVALMIEAAGVENGSRVLEIGAGSGYSAAIMCAMGARVTAIERHEGLADAARARLDRLHCPATIVTGDGTLGWPEDTPYDAVIVTAGGPKIPRELRRQLAVGGRLVIPVGPDRRNQSLMRIRRTGEDSFAEDDLGAVAFVPLVGEEGWRE